MTAEDSIEQCERRLRAELNTYLLLTTERQETVQDPRTKTALQAISKYAREAIRAVDAAATVTRRTRMYQLAGSYDYLSAGLQHTLVVETVSGRVIRQPFFIAGSGCEAIRQAAHTQYTVSAVSLSTDTRGWVPSTEKLIFRKLSSAGNVNGHTRLAAVFDECHFKLQDPTLVIKSAHVVTYYGAVIGYSGTITSNELFLSLFLDVQQDVHLSLRTARSQSILRRYFTNGRAMSKYVDKSYRLDVRRDDGLVLSCNLLVEFVSEPSIVYPFRVDLPSHKGVISVQHRRISNRAKDTSSLWKSVMQHKDHGVSLSAIFGSKIVFDCGGPVHSAFLSRAGIRQHFRVIIIPGSNCIEVHSIVLCTVAATDEKTCEVDHRTCNGV